MVEEREQKGRKHKEEAANTSSYPAQLPPGCCSLRGGEWELAHHFSVFPPVPSCQLRAGLHSCQLAPWFKVNRGAFPFSPSSTAQVSP